MGMFPINYTPKVAPAVVAAGRITATYIDPLCLSGDANVQSM